MSRSAPEFRSGAEGPREQVFAGVGAEVLRRLEEYGVYEELAGTSATGDATHSLAEQIVTVDRGALFTGK
ncbi:hypothetical protein [Streptomyces sp. NPDC094472]|uniref:hypothetical protein n=1 Tax=unclassified Streptomyces TaxID=2593676 RepID=UPI0033339245